MRLYLDAAPAIYLVECVDPYFAKMVAKYGSGVYWSASELTRLECLVKPYREANDKLINAFTRFFDKDVHRFVALDRAVLDRAARLRARYRFKTPDAIHLAAAIQGGCDAFVTNDHRLDRCAEIKIEVIER